MPGRRAENRGEVLKKIIIHHLSHCLEAGSVIRGEGAPVLSSGSGFVLARLGLQGPAFHDFTWLLAGQVGPVITLCRPFLTGRYPKTDVLFPHGNLCSEGSGKALA